VLREQHRGVRPPAAVGWLAVHLQSVAVLSPASSPNGQLTDITNAMIYGITAFAGFEAAAALGEEARDARRSSLPPLSAPLWWRASSICSSLLRRCSMLGMTASPSSRCRATPLGHLTSQYWSPSALWVIDLVVVLTGLSFVIASLNVAIRILHAMGRERALPGALARLSSRQTPAVSIGCVAMLTLVLGLPLTYADGGTRTFGYLAGAGGLSVVLVYLAVECGRSSYVAQAKDESGVTNKAVDDHMVIDHEGSLIHHPPGRGGRA
jgi:amino acid transporter